MPKSTMAAEPAAAYIADTPARAVRLFRNGANQAVRIPRELELPGTEATIRKVGGAIVIEAVEPKLIKGSAKSLLAVLSTMQPIDEEFPDVDEGLLPLDDIQR